MGKRLQQFTVRCFAGLGYTLALLQWFFVLIVYLSIAQQYELLDGFMKTSDTPAVSSPITLPQVGVVEYVVMGSAVVVIVFSIVYMLRRLPGSVLRGGRELTHAPAEVLTPLILRYRHGAPTNKQRLHLTAQLVLVIKAVVVIVPILALLPVIVIAGRPLELSVMWSISICIAIVSIVCFACEWVLATIFNIAPDKTD